MSKHDKETIKVVAKGNAPCKSDSDCTASGRDLGSCEKSRCVCNAGFTGPRCLVSNLPYFTFISILMVVLTY